MPLNCIPSHHLQTAPRQTRVILRRGRGAVVLHRAYTQVELASSSDEAPTSSRSIYLRAIHRQIDHNEMLQRRLAHSTKLLREAERIAIGEGNAPAPQAVRPLAPAMPNAPIHRSIGGNCAQASALAPLGCVCARPRLRGIRYIF
jgi:hypothetical protein